jgi:hypothetical protein
MAAEHTSRVPSFTDDSTLVTAHVPASERGSSMRGRCTSGYGQQIVTAPGTASRVSSGAGWDFYTTWT